MTDFRVAGALFILLVLLTIIWSYPFFRPEIRANRIYRMCKAYTSLTAGLVLLGLAAFDPVMDLFLILRLVAGFTLLYDGAVTILNLYDDMMNRRNRGSVM